MKERIEYLKSKIESEVTAFRRRRVEYKKRYIYIKVAISVLAALTTILLGLQGLPPNNIIQNVTLSLSATITLFTSLDAFFNHRALYLRYTATTAQLYDLRSDLQYLLTKGEANIRDEELDDIYKKLRNLLEETGTDWIKARREVKTEDAT